MPIPFIVDNIESVAEPLRTLYVKQEDGKFVLGVEGAVPRSKLEEFRDNNIELNKQIAKFKDVDPAKYRELMALQTQLDEKKLIEAGKVDEVVNQRVQTMKGEYDGQINDLKKNNDTLTRQLETLIIDNTVRDVSTKSGVLPTAVDDVLLRAKTLFKIKDGVATPLDAKGQVIYGKDGQNPQPISEWLEGLKEAAPHLFQGSQGAGSQGSGGRGPSNPNMTATQKIAAGLNA